MCDCYLCKRGLYNAAIENLFPPTERFGSSPVSGSYITVQMNAVADEIANRRREVEARILQNAKEKQMTWYKFSEKLPEVDRYIWVNTENFGLLCGKGNVLLSFSGSNGQWAYAFVPDLPKEEPIETKWEDFKDSTPDRSKHGVWIGRVDSVFVYFFDKDTTKRPFFIGSKDRWTYGTGDNKPQPPKATPKHATTYSVMDAMGDIHVVYAERMYSSDSEACFMDEEGKTIASFRNAVWAKEVE